MATLNEHMKDCKRLIGKSWKKVHLYLDQYAHDPFHISIFNDYHRTFLHNRYGIEMIRALYGLQAELAAKIHIVRDYMGMNIDHKELNWVNEELGKALMYFNNLDQFNPGIRPSVINAWDGKSLVAIAFGEE